VLIFSPPSCAPANNIAIGKQSSSSLISKAFLGVLPAGGSIEHTLFLRANGTSGDRTLDFSVQTRLASIAASTTEHGRSASEASAATDGVKLEERMRTLVIPCVRPLAVAFDLKRYPPLGPQRRLLELLDENDDDGFEPTEEVLVSARFEMLGPAAIVVESISFVPEVRRALSTTSLLGSRVLMRCFPCASPGGRKRPADFLIPVCQHPSGPPFSCASTSEDLQAKPRTDLARYFPIFAGWEHGHSFSAICGFAVDTTADDDGPDDDDLPLAALRHASPGYYDVIWRRSVIEAACHRAHPTPSES